MTNLPQSKLGGLKGIYVMARKEAEKGNVAKALQILKETPGGARDLTIHPQIATNLRNLGEKNFTLRVSLEGFTNIPIWNRAKTLIISGPTEIGKTSLAKALLPRALFVSHMDQLRAYDSTRHEGVIFDDMSFKHLHREAQIHIADTYEPRAIHVRYAIALLPENTPRILTTNRDYDGVLDTTDPAIRRRCSAWKMFWEEIDDDVRVRRIEDFCISKND